ncbi:cytochrome p450 [Moniliophthora roreri MCA 2997]|uniref:Cytochrome p450 n=1 Tax=Moniliophthora roreri (strain MCA 2997) TaxID=1381753 RepID=V2WS55_MONRO|nr:cytochrome p450 [Moniliophthora roreri MCA 2997]
MSLIIHDQKYPLVLAVFCLVVGPKPLPLLGNFFGLPARFEWLTYIEWGRKYHSDILHFSFAGTHTIVLNSREAINDLLEKKSDIYSSRPKWTMLNDVIRWAWTLVTMPYGKQWNARRKLIHQEFNPKQTARYETQHQKAIHNFLADLLRDPGDFYHLMRHMAGSIILSVTYGITVKTSVQGEPAIDMADRALHGFVAAGVPGSFLVDYIPLLQLIPSWLPGASWKRKAIKWGEDADRMLNEPFETVKKNIAEGTQRPCFVSYCLEKGNLEDPEYEQVVKESAGAMYLGTDTSVCALHIFFFAVIRHPHVVHRAQQELDREVGSERLPDARDLVIDRGEEVKLPYVWAILNEVMRWQPVNPMGLAHLVTEDDEYRGYRIPKNSVVLGNAWVLLHDESVYGEHPDSFIPERWLTPDGKVNQDIPEPTIFWGTGRRICPGRQFVLSSMFAIIASVLHCFDISAPSDEPPSSELSV